MSFIILSTNSADYVCTQQKQNVMKKIFHILLFTAAFTSCNNNQNSQSDTTNAASAPTAGQSAVQDNISQKDVVKVAVGSNDHTTLVTALKAAEYVDVLSNAGPKVEWSLEPTATFT